MEGNEIERMANALQSDRNSNGYKRKLYKVESDEHKQQMLTDDIRNKACALRDPLRAKVDLAQTEDVRNRVSVYMDACAESGTFPSMSGLCAFGFNVSRQWVSRWKLQHPQHPTTMFLDTVSDAFASILVNAGLYGNASAPMCIFELKNTAGYRDQVDIAPVKVKPEQPEVDIEEIRRRYMPYDNTYDD